MVDEKVGKGKTEKESIVQVSGKPELTDMIGQRLRSYFNEVANQPVPDRFLDLLEELETAEEKTKNDAN
jgi:Anti-sigma factor NepR